MIKLKQIIYKKIPKNLYPFFLKLWYFVVTKKVLDLKNPKTFNEKIQWLKLYDSTPLKTKLTDKYEVREWIKDKIGEEYLVPLLGVWDKFEDIDFDKLPDRFVLKATHGSAMNIIVKDKNNFDKNDAKKKFNNWLKINFAFSNGFEMHYKDIKPRIIAEEYIKDYSKNLIDYKVLCFSGIPKYIWVDIDRAINHKRNIYDLKWNLLNVKINKYSGAYNVKKPYNLEKIIEFSKILSQDFIHARVDFYESNQKLYFGEITFTSESGSSKVIPHEFAKELGDLIKIK